MRVYLVQRIDQWGGWLARPGRGGSYVVNKRDARKFKTREEAEAVCCENEVVREQWRNSPHQLS